MDCRFFRDDMLDVLYGQASPEAERRVRAHQAACPACAEEMAALREVRQDLHAWTLPATVGATHIPSPRPGPSLAPRFGRALGLAASLLLAFGAGVLGSRLDWREGRLALSQPADGATVQALLAEQEQRHRREIDELRGALAARPVSAEARIDDAAVLRRVAELIRDSEARQGAVLRASLGRETARLEAQRHDDLRQIGAAFSYVEGKAGLQAARTTELVGQVLLASQKK
jgi:hypothetical protein